jgi:hypothetical protein
MWQVGVKLGKSIEEDETYTERTAEGTTRRHLIHTNHTLLPDFERGRHISRDTIDSLWKKIMGVLVKTLSSLFCLKAGIWLQALDRSRRAS